MRARSTITAKVLRTTLVFGASTCLVFLSSASAHTPVPPYRITWSIDLPSPVSTPAVAGTTVILVGQDAVLGVDEATAAIAWSVPRAGGALLPPAIGYVGGTAVVVYVEKAAAPTTGASPSPGAATPADLVAIDLDTRAERWRVPFAVGLPGGVLAWGADAYVVDGAGTLTAVALADGTTSWTADAVGTGDAPPVGYDDTVYVAGRGAVGPVRISAFDAATGERRWAKSPESAASSASGVSVSADVVAYAGNDRLLHVLDRADGTERWTALLGNLPSPVTAPIIDADAVYVVDFSGTVGRFDLANGARAWSFPLNDVVVRSSPLLADEAIVVGTGGGRLVAIDRATGHLVADLETGDGLLGGFAVPGHLLVVAKGGADPVLLGIDTDATAEVLDVPSPIELDLVGTLGRFVAAALVALAAVGLPPRVAARLRRRRGPSVDAGGAA